MKMNNQIVTLETTINLCLENKDFMQQYKRLTGAKLGSGSIISNMIDKATGFDKKEYIELFDFIKNYVYLPYLKTIQINK